MATEPLKPSPHAISAALGERETVWCLRFFQPNYGGDFNAQCPGIDQTVLDGDLVDVGSGTVFQTKLAQKRSL